MADTELPPTAVEVVSPEGVRVVILGTAHVSKKSVEEAEALMLLLRPTVCFVELCAQRRAMLTMPVEVTPAQAPSLMEGLRSGGSLMQVAISTFYGDLVQQLQLEVNPGAEFAAAARIATQQGCPIFLGDRELRVTLSRAWHSLSWFERIKIIYSFFTSDMSGEDIEKIKESDMLTELIEEAGKECPGLLEPLLYERDRYLTYNLRAVCQKVARDPAPADGRQRTVLAVVGLGHQKGMVARFGHDLDHADFQAISIAPQGLTFAAGLVRYVVVPAAVCALGYVVLRRYRR